MQKGLSVFQVTVFLSAFLQVTRVVSAHFHHPQRLYTQAQDHSHSETRSVQRVGWKFLVNVLLECFHFSNSVCTSIDYNDHRFLLLGYFIADPFMEGVNLYYKQ